MKIRKDSPFYGITEREIQSLMVIAEDGTLLEVVEEWLKISGREANVEQTKRFLTRVRQEHLLRDWEDSEEDLQAFADRAEKGRARDGIIEAARQRLFEEALEKGDSAILLELYRSANQERALENQAAVQRRKATVAEENAKIGWKKLEILAGRDTNQKLLKKAVVETGLVEAGAPSNEAEAALRLLPKLRAVLEEAGGTAEERLGRVREALGVGTLLLVEGSNSTQSRKEAEAQRET